MVSTQEKTLVKPEVYETKRILLTSPILHIGSEVSKLSPFEYVQTDSRVYRPNQEALVKALYHKGKLQEYIRRIENREEITSLLKEAFGDNWQNEKLEGQAIFPNTGISRNWTEEKISDLRPMIRNGFGQIYIPGSSIKGAIRTAIAYHLLTHANQYKIPSSYRVSEIEKKLRKKIKTGEIARKDRQMFLDDKLFINFLFTEFEIADRENIIFGPNTDFMRAIKVTDSQPLLEETKTIKEGKKATFNLPVVAEVMVSSKLADGKAKYRASLYAEMVRNVRTNFTISLDQKMLDRFHHIQGLKIPFKNIDEILKICREFAQHQWDYEHDYWEEIKDSHFQVKKLYFEAIRKFYEPIESPYGLRLGWASGMRGTTINLCLNDEIVEEVRDNCGIMAPGFEAPKSRRTVINNEGDIKFALGWVKFNTLKSIV
jgi:CRISPR-associated protein Csm5